MAYDFPSSPVLNQTYTSGSTTYRYNGSAWVVVNSAAPFDAMAYSGMQINGGMEVSQESGSTAVSTGGYVVDGFSAGIIGYPSFAIAAQQVTDAPPGFCNSVKISVTTAKASLAATDEVILGQTIEGLRLARLAFGTASAQSVSISFWCKVHRTGTYSGSISNSPYNRTYAFTWVQSVADTWEYKTITISGDTTGVWPKDNTAGAYLSFVMAGGTSALTAPNVWTAAGKDGATGQINGIAATSDTFQITGVTVLPGTQAPTAAQSPNIMRPYDQELVTCQRYYEILRIHILGSATAGGQYFMSRASLAPKRAVPTCAVKTIIGHTNDTAGLVLNEATLESVFYQIWSWVAGTTEYIADVSADARL